MAEFVKVAAAGDIPTDTGKCVDVGGKQVAVFNVNGSFHAIDNACLHQSGPLSDGDLTGHVVTCPWHAWTFDVSTGKLTTGTGAGVSRYECKREGDDILVAV